MKQEELRSQLNDHAEERRDGVLDAGPGDVVQVSVVDSKDLTRAVVNLCPRPGGRRGNLDYAREIRSRLSQLQQDHQQDRQTLPSELLLVEKGGRAVRG